MNSLSISQTNGKDRSARPLVATFYVGGTDGYSMAVPGRYCSNVVSCFGDSPSYALVGIPAKEIFAAGTWDQTGPNALSNNGAAKKIKLMARCSIGYLDNGIKTTLLNGWVVYETHQLREDSITCCVFDDRYIMTKYTNFGRMRYEPSGSGSGAAHVFISNPSDKQVFNENGHGNCIDAAGIGPRFSPGHRYGHLANGQDDGEVEPEPGSSTTKARKWTIKDILTYLRDMFYDVGKRPPLGQDFGPMELPMQYIKWPKGLGSNIVENKTPRDLDLDGLDLLSALRRVVQTAGPYDIHMEPINEKESELKIIDFSLKDNTGSLMYTARYLGATLDEAMHNPCIIWDGWVKESALQTFNGGAAVMGDAPATELMASTDTDTATAQGTALGFLERGWTAAEETAFKRLTSSAAADAGQAIYQPADSKTYNAAVQRYPNVFSWYKLSATKNPFGTTKWANYSQSGTLRIKAHQLTSFNQNEVNPLGMTPREIIIEYKLTDLEYSGITDPAEQARGYWRFAGRYSELQLSLDGRYIQVPALRDTQKTYYAEGGSPVAAQPVYDGQYMTARHIRIQLAAESNHCLTARAGASDQDPSGTLARMDSNAPKNALQIRNGPMQYIDWTRTAYSFPVGRGGFTTAEYNTLAGANGFGAKQSAGNELFTDHIGNNDTTNPKNRLARHADVHVKNFKKVTYEGVLIIKRLTPVWRVGQQITIETTNTIGKVSGIIRCVIYSASGQSTSVEFGPNTPSAIYDGPYTVSSMASSGGVFGGGGGGGNTPKTPDKITSDNDSPRTTTQSGGSGTTSPVSAQQTNAGSDNDGDTNNQAIKNNSSANTSTRGTGGGGNAGMGESNYRRSEDELAAGRPNAGIYEGASLQGKDALAREEGNSAAGIYSGNSLKAKDDADQFRPTEFDEFGNMTRMGGVKDRFRPGYGSTPETRGAPSQSASQEVRQQEQFNANVAQGFNPNGAVSTGQSSRGRAAATPVKNWQSSADWMKSKGVRSSTPETRGSLNSANFGNSLGVGFKSGPRHGSF